MFPIVFIGESGCQLHETFFVACQVIEVLAEVPEKRFLRQGAFNESRDEGMVSQRLDVLGRERKSFFVPLKVGKGWERGSRERKGGRLQQQTARDHGAATIK